MNKKKILTALVVAALPLLGLYNTVQAEVIPVTIASGSDQEANPSQEVNASQVSNSSQGSNDLPQSTSLNNAPSHRTAGTRISSSASPETNKAIREETNTLSKSFRTVVAPDADSYMNRMKVGVTPSVITADHVNITYPVVSSVSKVVSNSINKEIVSYVKDVQNDIEKVNAKAATKDNVYISYDVKTDDKGILSLLMYKYTIADNAANGSIQIKGFTFNSTSGKILSLVDFGHVDKLMVESVIKNDPALRAKFASNFTGLSTSPNQFFAGADHSVTMVIQQGEEAAFSEGPIFVPVGIPRSEQVLKK